MVADGADWGTLAWTVALGLSNLIVMVTVPAIGAYANLRVAKKRLLMLTTAACVVATLALAGVGRGDVTLAVVAIVLSNLHFFLQRYRETYRLELAHFFESLLSGKPFRTGIADGVEAQKLADAAALSLASGQVVAL